LKITTPIHTKASTGMRLGEALGLLKSDINLVGDIPYVEINPHP